MAPVALKVGFPMPGNEDARAPTKAPDDLTITFDGEAASVTPSSASKEDRDARRDWAWYHCRHTLTPPVTSLYCVIPTKSQVRKWRRWLFQTKAMLPAAPSTRATVPSGVRT